MTTRKYSKEQVLAWAEAWPEAWVENHCSTSKAAMQLGMADTRARAIGVYANLVRHYPEMAEAARVAVDLQTDIFREVAVKIGTGAELKIRNNYPGQKWLEANEPERWNPKQQVQVEGTGFSAEDLPKEGGGSGQVVSAVELIRQRVGHE